MQKRLGSLGFKQQRQIGYRKIKENVRQMSFVKQCVPDFTPDYFA